MVYLMGMLMIIIKRFWLSDHINLCTKAEQFTVWASSECTVYVHYYSIAGMI